MLKKTLKKISGTNLWNKSPHSPSPIPFPLKTKNIHHHPKQQTQIHPVKAPLRPYPHLPPLTFPFHIHPSIKK